jgi:hypothetical protein
VPAVSVPLAPPAASAPPAPPAAPVVADASLSPPAEIKLSPLYAPLFEKGRRWEYELSVRSYNLTAEGSPVPKWDSYGLSCVVDEVRSFPSTKASRVRCEVHSKEKAPIPESFSATTAAATKQMAPSGVYVADARGLFVEGWPDLAAAEEQVREGLSGKPLLAFDPREAEEARENGYYRHTKNTKGTSIGAKKKEEEWSVHDGNRNDDSDATDEWWCFVAGEGTVSLEYAMGGGANHSQVSATLVPAVKRK